MPDTDLLRVFRTLTQAAARFEKKAAKHQRVEAERKALQEALTDAQLVLSLQQRKPLAEVRSLKGRRHSEGFGEAAREESVLVLPDLAYRQAIAELLAEVIPPE